jgi:hypothetical protein
MLTCKRDHFSLPDDVHYLNGAVGCAARLIRSPLNQVTSSTASQRDQADRRN